MAPSKNVHFFKIYLNCVQISKQIDDPQVFVLFLFMLLFMIFVFTNQVMKAFQSGFMRAEEARIIMQELPEQKHSRLFVFPSAKRFCIYFRCPCNAPLSASSRPLPFFMVVIRTPET